MICIGNLTMGGSGKTPVALALGKILREMNIEFAYLTRGYGSKGNKFGFVEKNSRVAEVGDEPLLLAEMAPTFIAKDRLKGAQEITKMPKIKAILMDDGMQNHSLQKDLLSIVVDSRVQFGNGFLFPAGPLREPLSSGLKKADFVVLVGENDEKLQKKMAAKKILQAKIIAKNAHEFSHQKLLAFCGLAHPEKFFSYLEAQGLDVVGSHPFPDHHFYNKIELDQLVEIAQKQNAKLITTKKDWVKFAPIYQEKIEFLDVELSFVNQALVRQELKKILGV